MAPTMASELERGCRVLFWLERVAFLSAFTLSAVSPASWCLGIVLLLAFQVMSFVRLSIQPKNPESKSNWWILFIAEHVAAIFFDGYLIFGLQPLAAKALLLFEASCAIHLLLVWWAEQSGEVAKVFLYVQCTILPYILEKIENLKPKRAFKIPCPGRKVWAKLIDKVTDKTEEEDSVAKPVESKVEQEAARLESPEKQTVEAEPNLTPAEAAGREDKTSEGHVDKLKETAKPAACCEANDEEMLNASQLKIRSGEPPLAAPQESRAGDKSRPSKKPRHVGVAPEPEPRVGMYGEYLQIRGKEDYCSQGRGYYAGPWAQERGYLLEELEKAKGTASMYHQLAFGYSEGIHQLATEKLQLASKLEDLTLRHNNDREELRLLRESFKALCDSTFNLAATIRHEASCAEYYKECCLEYSEGKGLLQEENAWLEAEVEELRKQLDESECKRQALEENTRLGTEMEELRKRLEESECNRQALEENTRFGTEMEELRKRLEESECKRQALEENTRLGAETEELRKRLEESECKRQALEEQNACLNTNLTVASALCEVYCFLLKYISRFDRVNS